MLESYIIMIKKMFVIKLLVVLLVMLFVLVSCSNSVSQEEIGFCKGKCSFYDYGFFCVNLSITGDNCDNYISFMLKELNYLK